MRTDVLVIGGGPAGLYAAQLLARAGLQVRVLEEHDTIGQPVHCTGVLGTEAFALSGVPRNAIVGWPNVARFHSPVGHRLVYTGPEGEVCVIDRGVFDRGLAEAAAAAGTEITTAARAVGLEIEADGVTAHARLRGGLVPFRARVCVLACGATYQLQRALGWGVPPLVLGSAQTEVAASGDGEVEVFLRADLAPTGFGWLVPFRRGMAPRAKVGVMAPTGARRALARLLEDFREPTEPSPLRSPVITRLLPLAPLRRTYGHRVLVIGDAAGLVKPTTGGGIYYSLLSAGWAATAVRSAFEKGDFSAVALGAYEETWRAHLGAELRVGVWFRQLAKWLTPGDLDALVKLAITDGLLPVVRATARFNWHREMILQALRRPGVLQIVLRRLVGAAAGGGAL